MTLGQIRLFIREADQIERRRRAAFISDVHAAVSGLLSEGGGEGTQDRINELLGRA